MGNTLRIGLAPRAGSAPGLEGLPVGEAEGFPGPQRWGEMAPGA